MANSRQFELIQNETDWDKYRFSTAQIYNTTSSQVEWGSGPKQFPCLAASYPASPAKIVTCYVYMDDAKRLLFSEASLAGPPVDRGESDVSEEDAVAMRATHLMSEMLKEKQLDRDDFERHVSSMLLSIVKILVDTSIIKEGQFEKMLVNYQRLVDEWVTENRSKVSGGDKIILDRLYP